MMLSRVLLVLFGLLSVGEGRLEAHTSTAGTIRRPRQQPKSFLPTRSSSLTQQPPIQRGGAVLTPAKLANLQERALPAIGLLVALYGIIWQFGDAGLATLLLFLTPGLYHEACEVVHEGQEVTPTPPPPEVVVDVNVTVHNETTNATSDVESDALTAYSNRWWWFAAYSMLSTLPRFLTLPDAVLQMTGLCMIAGGWVAWIVHLNKLDAAHFRSAWSQVAHYHMAILLTLVPAACWIATIDEFGRAWALYAALLVIINDTMAYLVGFSLGKSPLLPVISPKKTWEGFGGALVSTLALSLLLWKVFFPADGYNHHAFLIALYCSTVAPFGGFMASTVKRAYDRKDFGNLIAGHGGLVDRLDCQLMTAPFVYLYLRAVAQSS